MKVLTSLLPWCGLLAVSALLPNQALALAYHDGAANTAISTTSDEGYSLLDGVGYVLTAKSQPGDYVACSGAALSSRIILTASHCFDFNFDNQTDNSRSTFYAWEGKGLNRGVTRYDGQVFASPQREITLVGGYKAYSDIALIVLDSPLEAATPTYAVYDGALSGAALDRLGDGAMLVGYGQHHEEGQFVEGGSAYNRWVGYGKVDGYDPTKGGTLSASLVQGASILAPGDSGGPLMSWTQMGGAPLGVIFGTGAYVRDNQGNGRYSDLGDEAFWSFVGMQADFIREVAAQYGETVTFYSGSNLTACSNALKCRNFPTSGPVVPGIPEPGQTMLLLGGLCALAAWRKWTSGLNG